MEKEEYNIKKYPIISEYNDSKITFGEHAERLEKESSKYCNGEDKYICTDIDSVKDQNEKTYEIKDCSNYIDQFFKDLYESTNNLIH